jgi:hypothetical protein
MYLAVNRDSNFLPIMCSWFCIAVVITEPVLVITRILVEVNAEKTYISAYSYLMRISKNSLLWRIFEPKCNGGWRKLCNEEPHYWLPLPGSKRMVGVG